MRWVVSGLVLAALSWSVFAAQTPPPQSYWLLSKNDGQTWCRYRDEARFKSEANKLKPEESARVTYSSNKLMELTYQVEPESGDWIVIDKYVPSDKGILLRRANLLTQRNLEVIEAARIRRGKAEPFRIVNVTTFDGKKAEASGIDFPAVPVRTNLAAIPFMAVAAAMRSRSLAMLCKRVGKKRAVGAVSSSRRGRR